MRRLFLALTLAGCAFPAEPYTSWKEHLGGADSAQYSALSQINRNNVGQIQQVWFYPSGDNGFRYGFNPIVVDGLV